jgi:hypothetical protein
VHTKLPSVAKIFLGLVVSAAAGVQAAPIVFANAQYDTTAVAFSGAVVDVNSSSSVTSPLPLVSTATVTGPNDFATSFAIATSGLLSASSEADSFPGAAGASAEAQSHFVGNFTGGGALLLNFDFVDLTSLVGGGTGAGTLFVQLSNTFGGTTTTLLNNVFTNGGDTTLSLFVAGGISTLDVLLFSEADSRGVGQSAQNFSQVAFGGTLTPNAVPVPPTLALVLIALGAMVGVRRKAAGAQE